MDFNHTFKHVSKHMRSMAHVLILCCILALLNANMISAATLSGNIYDMALQKEYDIVVEIDTVPNQLMVSKDGYYSFNVNPGNYTLHAYTSTSETREYIAVSDEGEYVLDLVLEDNIPASLDGISLADPDIVVSSSLPADVNKNAILLAVLITLFIVLIIALSVFFLVFRKKKHSNTNMREASGKPMLDHEKASAETEDVDGYEQKILLMIKKEKRTTQKDVRKEIPLSEAKISLILTDLEDKGKIRKIKKGRGNVLIFVKD